MIGKSWRWRRELRLTLAILGIVLAGLGWWQDSARVVAVAIALVAINLALTWGQFER
jgi:hypothetical protein